MIHPTHDLYTPNDFPNDPESQLAQNVIDGGLAICKNCSEFEKGLETPCCEEKGDKNGEN